MSFHRGIVASVDYPFHSLGLCAFWDRDASSYKYSRTFDAATGGAQELLSVNLALQVGILVCFRLRHPFCVHARNGDAALTQSPRSQQRGRRRRRLSTRLLRWARFYTGRRCGTLRHGPLAGESLCQHRADLSVKRRLGGAPGWPGSCWPARRWTPANCS